MMSAFTHKIQLQDAPAQVVEQMIAGEDYPVQAEKT